VAGSLYRGTSALALARSEDAATDLEGGEVMSPERSGRDICKPAAFVTGFAALSCCALGRVAARVELLPDAHRPWMAVAGPWSQQQQQAGSGGRDDFVALRGSKLDQEPYAAAHAISCGSRDLDLAVEHD
jgi:hypothetical protein